MRSMFRNLITISVVWLTSASLLAGADNNAFTLQKKLLPPETRKRDVASVELDEEVLAETTDDYSNLRVFDSEDVETPVLVRAKRRKKSVIQEQSVTMENVLLNE